MNISIIGTGFVGLSTAAVFAETGNNVICVDIDKAKIDKLKSGKAAFYEKGLDEILSKNVKKGKLRATTDIRDAIENSEITFISVGTPSREDGSINTDFVKKASEQIGEALKNKKNYHVIVVKSTVVPGTTEKTVKTAIEKTSGKTTGKDFGLCMSPEFLREGSAIYDSMNPDRIVIGESDKKAGDIITNLYKPFNSKIIRTNIKTAEMIKYASNVFLASKISLINEIGNICKKLGIDTYEIADAVGMDKRIGREFLNSGCGFGGSCFEKDMKAIINKAEENMYEPKIIKESLNLNKKQKMLPVKMLEAKLGNLQGKKIAVLGLAFKSDTDDMRDSPSVDIISDLLKRKSIVTAYDPKANDNAKKIFPSIKIENSAKNTIKNSDACLILTDWPEFRELSDNDFNLMKNKVIIEGRRILDKNKVKNFEGVCW